MRHRVGPIRPGVAPPAVQLRSVVLPFIPFLLGRVTCTACGKDEVVTRAAVKVGLSRACPSCGKRYRVGEIRNVTSKGTGRPASKPLPSKPLPSKPALSPRPATPKPVLPKKAT